MSWHSHLPNVHPLDRARKISPRVLGFGSSDLWERSAQGISTTAAFETHSNDLSANEGERSLRYHRPPAQELALRALNVVILRERTGVLPVSEPKAVVVGACIRSARRVEGAKGQAAHLLQGRSQCRG